MAKGSSSESQESGVSEKPLVQDLINDTELLATPEETNNIQVNGESFIEKVISEQEEARQKAEQAAIQHSGEEARQKAEEEARLKVDEDAKQTAAEEARQKAEEETRQKAEEESRQKAVKEAKEKAEEEARQKAEEEAKQIEDSVARQKAEEQARQRIELEARQRSEEEARQRFELEARQRLELEARQRAELEAKQKAEAEARLRVAEEARLREIEEAKLKEERERANYGAITNPLDINNMVMKTASPMPVDELDSFPITVQPVASAHMNNNPEQTAVKAPVASMIDEAAVSEGAAVIAGNYAKELAEETSCVMEEIIQKSEKVEMEAVGAVGESGLTQKQSKMKKLFAWFQCNCL